MIPEDVMKQLETRLAVFAATSGLKISVSLERKGSRRSKFAVFIADPKEEVQIVAPKIKPVPNGPPLGTKIKIGSKTYSLTYIRSYAKFKYQFNEVGGGRLRRMSEAAFNKYFRSKAF